MAVPYIKLIQNLSGYSYPYRVQYTSFTINLSPDMDLRNHEDNYVFLETDYIRDTDVVMFKTKYANCQFYNKANNKVISIPYTGNIKTLKSSEEDINGKCRYIVAYPIKALITEFNNQYPGQIPMANNLSINRDGSDYLNVVDDGIINIVEPKVSSLIISERVSIGGQLALNLNEKIYGPDSAALSIKEKVVDDIFTGSEEMLIKETVTTESFSAYINESAAITSGVTYANKDIEGLVVIQKQHTVNLAEYKGQNKQLFLWCNEPTYIKHISINGILYNVSSPDEEKVLKYGAGNTYYIAYDLDRYIVNSTSSVIDYIVCYDNSIRSYISSSRFGVGTLNKDTDNTLLFINEGVITAKDLSIKEDVKYGFTTKRNTTMNLMENIKFKHGEFGTGYMTIPVKESVIEVPKVFLNISEEVLEFIDRTQKQTYISGLVHYYEFYVPGDPPEYPATVNKTFPLELYSRASYKSQPPLYTDVLSNYYQMDINIPPLIKNAYARVKVKAIVSEVQYIPYSYDEEGVQVTAFVAQKKSVIANNVLNYMTIKGNDGYIASGIGIEGDYTIFDLTASNASKISLNLFNNTQAVIQEVLIEYNNNSVSFPMKETVSAFKTDINVKETIELNNKVEDIAVKNPNTIINSFNNKVLASMLLSNNPEDNYIFYIRTDKRYIDSQIILYGTQGVDITNSIEKIVTNDSYYLIVRTKPISKLHGYGLDYIVFDNSMPEFTVYDVGTAYLKNRGYDFFNLKETIIQPAAVFPLIEHTFIPQYGSESLLFTEDIKTITHVGFKQDLIENVEGIDGIDNFPLKETIYLGNNLVFEGNRRNIVSWDTSVSGTDSKNVSLYYDSRGSEKLGYQEKVNSSGLYYKLYGTMLNPETFETINNYDVPNIIYKLMLNNRDSYPTGMLTDKGFMIYAPYWRNFYDFTKTCSIEVYAITNLNNGYCSYPNDMHLLTTKKLISEAGRAIIDSEGVIELDLAPYIKNLLQENNKPLLTDYIKNIVVFIKSDLGMIVYPDGGFIHDGSVMYTKSIASTGLDIKTMVQEKEVNNQSKFELVTLNYSNIATNNLALSINRAAPHNAETKLIYQGEQIYREYLSSVKYTNGAGNFLDSTYIEYTISTLPLTMEIVFGHKYSPKLYCTYNFKTKTISYAGSNGTIQVNVSVVGNLYKVAIDCSTVEDHLLNHVLLEYDKVTIMNIETSYFGSLFSTGKSTGNMNLGIRDSVWDKTWGANLGVVEDIVAPIYGSADFVIKEEIEPVIFIKAGYLMLTERAMIPGAIFGSANLDIKGFVDKWGGANMLNMLDIVRGDGIQRSLTIKETLKGNKQDSLNIKETIPRVGSPMAEKKVIWEIVDEDTN